MKTHRNTCLLLTALLLTGAGTASAQDTPAPRAKTETRVIVHDGDSDDGVATMAHKFRFEFDGDDDMGDGPQGFLGVESSKVSSTLREQLGLQPGIGLVVQRVIPDSGAVGNVQKHDILLKLDDQLLINAEQLGVLVRTKAPGTVVKLTVVRGGKQQVVEVKLGERKKPVDHVFEWQGDAGKLHGLRRLDGPDAGKMTIAALPEMSRADADRLMGRLDAAGRGLTIAREAGAVSIAKTDDAALLWKADAGPNVFVYSDDEGSVTLTAAQDGKILKLKGPGGDVTFEGPVTTDAERAALSDEVKARLKKIESIRRVETRTGDGFRTDGVRVLSAGAPTAVIYRSEADTDSDAAGAI